MSPYPRLAVEFVQIFSESHEHAVPSTDDVIPGRFTIDLLRIFPVLPVAPEVVVGVDGLLVPVPPRLLVIRSLLVVFGDIHIIVRISPRIHEVAHSHFVEAVWVSSVFLSELLDSVRNLIDVGDGLLFLRLFNELPVVDKPYGRQRRDDGHDNEKLDQGEPPAPKPPSPSPFCQESKCGTEKTSFAQNRVLHFLPQKSSTHLNQDHGWF